MCAGYFASCTEPVLGQRCVQGTWTIFSLGLLPSTLLSPPGFYSFVDKPACVNAEGRQTDVQ